MFRTAMGGFNKEDVNKYIVDINNEFFVKEEDFNKEIASLKEKLAISAERLNELVASLSSVTELEEKLAAAEKNAAEANAKLMEENTARLAAEAKLDEALAAADELKNSLSTKEDELKSALDAVDVLKASLAAKDEELKAALDAADGLKASLSAKDEELKSALDALEKPCSSESPEETHSENETAHVASDIEKLRLYDELRGNIGDIMISANKNADDIVKGAERRAADMARASKEKADALKRRLTVLTGRTVATLKKNAIQNADNCVKEFRACTDDISHMSRAMTSNLEKKYAELNAKMEAVGNELEEGIKNALREFDKGCNSIRGSINSETEK